MTKYKLTYEDATKISKAYKNFNFYATEFRIKGYKVVTFNYFLCDPRWFTTPLREFPEISAKDMRGVTFVFNEDGTLFKKFLMLEKFFNLNQTEETQEHLLKNKKIKNVTIKEDGSLVAFMQLPDKTVFTKTQGGFDNEQSQNALKIYNEDKNIKKFVDDFLSDGFTPLFEYVSFDNRIVLKYNKKELRLIGIRDNERLEAFISVADMSQIMDRYNIPVITTVSFDTLDEIKERMKTATDMEGVVIEFEDGQLVKIKTEWYFNLHGIRTENIFREDYIIQNFLKETLDEVTQDLDSEKDADAFAFIEYVKSATRNWSDYIDKSVQEFVDMYILSSDPWNVFAEKYHKKAFFGLMRTFIENPDIYNKKKIEYMLTKSYFLMDAKNIVEKWRK